MDKIVAEDWTNTFGQMEQRLVHSSSRYVEVAGSLKEPGLAEGNFSMVQMPGMLLRQVTLQAERQLLLSDAGEKEEADSLFILQGGVESKFPSAKNAISFGDTRHGFQYNPNYESEHIIRAGSFDVFQISFEVDFMKSLLQTAETEALDRVGQRMERKEGFMISPSLLVLQPRMMEIILAIRNCAFHGLTRYLFIEAKLLELLALQLEHIATTNLAQTKEQWSKADKEKLHAVKLFIEQHYLEQLSLTKITSAFGLNEFKLKKGFKHLFSTTVFGYIHHLRMQKAKQLLSEKVMNVSETAFFIGYNNIGSFSAEFKKRFGYSPSSC